MKSRMHAGRVKTLHPGVHGGILARRDDDAHVAALQRHDISTIDVVVVNLYPFRATVTAQQAPSFETAIENIDIGASARAPGVAPSSNLIAPGGSVAWSSTGFSGALSCAGRSLPSTTATECR